MIKQTYEKELITQKSRNKSKKKKKVRNEEPTGSTVGMNKQHRAHCGGTEVGKEEGKTEMKGEIEALKEN